MPPIASPSTNWLSLTQSFASALSWRNGITVKAPPKVSSPAFSPSAKSSAVRGRLIPAATRTATSGAGRAKRRREASGPHSTGARRGDRLQAAR